MRSIKEVRDSNSQSCTLQVKDTSQCNIPIPKDIRSAMEASLSLAIENSSGKVTFKRSIPHHRSCQKWILVPLPTSIYRCFEDSHSLRIFFHKPTPYGPLHSLEHHPPHRLSYFTSTTRLQRHLVNIGRSITQNYKNTSETVGHFLLHCTWS